MPLPPAHGEPLDDRQQLENGEQPRLGDRRNTSYLVPQSLVLDQDTLVHHRYMPENPSEKGNSIGQALRTMSNNLDVGYFDTS
jgi:hypothetical protein